MPVSDPELLALIRRTACLGCGSIPPEGVDAHHVKTRGAGGGDEFWNLLALCRSCHREIHTIGMLKMSQRHGAVKAWLDAAGWVYIEALKRWERTDGEEGLGTKD